MGIVLRTTRNPKQCCGRFLTSASEADAVIDVSTNLNAGAGGNNAARLNQEKKS
jgi:hypothetical protein